MAKEVEQLRDLAHQVAEIAHSEEMQQKREMWARHHGLEKVERPPVMCRALCWHELIPSETYVTTDPLYRQIETALRMRHYKATVICDDEVVEPWVEIPAVHLGEDTGAMWGVRIDVRQSGVSGGSFAFKPEIKEEEDIEKLRIPDWRVDGASTAEKHERACELLDGILDVRVTYGRLPGPWLAYWGAYLRGLEQMMYDCADRPEWFHRFVGFLSEAHVRHAKGLEADGHVTRNDHGVLNAVCYASADLPRPDFDGEHVRLVDTWTIGDSQEFSLVSPAMWDEFILTYQIPFFELHGLVSYGCCESLVGKVEILKRKVPNLRRVTVSPWSDIEYSAEHCDKAVIMQIRPMPSDVLIHFGEEEMRRDIAGKMERAGDALYDFCLQDIQSVFGRPETLQMWTAAAKEVGAEMYHRPAAGS